MTSRCAIIYTGHIDETHYVYTVDNEAIELQCDSKQDHKLGTGNITTKSVNRRTLMREYMKKKTGDQQNKYSSQELRRQIGKQTFRKHQAETKNAVCKIRKTVSAWSDIS